MNDAIEIQDNRDLAFFGKINASISHELKNIFAIISEASGLLNDLAVLAEKGKKIDMGMIKTCSQDIEEEIQRGFATIKEMNTFSHSVDRSIASVSPVDLVTLMVNIASYLSYASKVKINVSDVAEYQILTCPYRLQQLIYQALVYSYRTTGPEGEITVSFHAETNGDVRISFSDLGEKGDAKFPVEEMSTIAGSIHAKVRAVDEFESFDIIFPRAII
jgi:signal transduction histidine kinase